MVTCSSTQGMGNKIVLFLEELNQGWQVMREKLLYHGGLTELTGKCLFFIAVQNCADYSELS